MKLKWIMPIFLVIACLIFITRLRVTELKKEQFNRLYMKKVFENALVDATTNAKRSFDLHGGFGDSNLQTKKILDTIFNSVGFTLLLNNSELETLKKHIPLIVFLDFDGFYIYKQVEKENSINYLTLQKQYFVSKYGKDILHFDANDGIARLDSNRNYYESKVEDTLYRKELDIDFLKDKKAKTKSMFEQLQRAIKIAIPNYDLDLQLVLGSRAFEQGRGVMIFVENFKWKDHTYSDILYSGMGFSLFRLYYGFTKDNIKYYTDEKPENYIINSVFSSPKDAAIHGYRPYFKEDHKQKTH